MLLLVNLGCVLIFLIRWKYRKVVSCISNYPS